MDRKMMTTTMMMLMMMMMIWAEQWLLCPFFGLDRGPYLRTKWHIDPSSRLARIDMDQMQAGHVKAWFHAQIKLF